MQIQALISHRSLICPLPLSIISPRRKYGSMGKYLRKWWCFYVNLAYVMASVGDTPSSRTALCSRLSWFYWSVWFRASIPPLLFHHFIHVHQSSTQKGHTLNLLSVKSHFSSHLYHHPYGDVNHRLPGEPAAPWPPIALVSPEGEGVKQTTE